MNYSLPFHHYIERPVFDKEVATIFQKEWIPFAHTSEFKKKSFSLERSLLDHSIVLTRDGDQFHAFRNICAHRAGPLLWEEECSTGRSLRCKYHGWKYNLNGIRTKSPDFGATVEAHNLQELALQVWKGLIFINLHPEPVPFSLKDRLDEHAPGLENFIFHSTARHPLHCNWKTYIENYLEGYHISYLHPSLRASIDQSEYQIHVHGDLITHEVPADPNATVSGFWAYLWPNTALNIYGKGMSIERILPIDEHHTQIHYLYLFQEGTSEEEIQNSIAMSRKVTEEDIQICEAIAKNLRCKTYFGGPLSPKHEHGILYVHNKIRKAMM